MDDFTAIIPARYASTRLPGKPLLPIAGKPMILHVAERAAASAAKRVIVATDDQRIASTVAAAGVEACMTRTDHESGTDRLEEVCRTCKLGDEEIIVNLQGDEPLMPAEVIDSVAAGLVASKCDMATMAEPITTIDEAFDPNVVKVVCACDGSALYFSRAPIPWAREAYADDRTDSLPAELPVRRHLGIYAYRVRLLRNFVRWQVGALEAQEKLEQLRALGHGVRIHVADAPCTIPPGIDTPEDYQRVRAVLEC